MKRFNICLLYLILLLATPYCLFGQGTVHESLKIKSEILGQTERYSIYLPTNYSYEQSYPVIYLLHGYGGSENSWLKRTNITTALDSLIKCKALPSVIVIFPNGRNSYFINDYAGNYKFEDYFISEFIPAIDSIYPVSAKQCLRAIGGLSMGGFGAVLLPIKHPKEFGTSINISGAVRTQQDFIEMTPVKYHKNFAPLYGPELVGKDRITTHWLSNSPHSLIDSTNNSILKKINWYFDCGNNDFLFSANEQLHNLYSKYNIEHEYHIRPGTHSWDYWQQSIILALTYWGEYLKLHNSVNPVP